LLFSGRHTFKGWRVSVKAGAKALIPDSLFPIAQP
jgi:hypothetical protein